MISGQNSEAVSTDFRDNLPQVADDEKVFYSSYSFCRWVVAKFKFLEPIMRYIDNWLVDRSYKKTLHEYNISDVLEKVSGEKNKLGQGAYGRVERYQMVAEDTQNPEEPQELQVAYKVLDISVQMRDLNSLLLGREAITEHANYCAGQEKKALAALSHPNIIKPVTSYGKTDCAEKATVFELKNFSQEEKTSLKQDVPRAIDPPDFDFEIIESVTTGPAGVPLALADTTLAEQIRRRSLTIAQKDSVIRAMIDGLAHMHENGYVHLDVKPGNVLRKGDKWMLCDLGSAHHYSELKNGSMDCMPFYIPRSFFCALFLFGSQDYVSPQVRSRFYINSMSDRMQRVAHASMSQPEVADPVFYTDARQADAYSLGVVLFEVLTGVNPKHRGVPIKNLPVEGYTDIYQAHVDKLLKKHKSKIGAYYEVVAGLLKADCGQRMTVQDAQRYFAERESLCKDICHVS